jgi:DNA-binding MarR family transcriptional regulator
MEEQKSTSLGRMIIDIARLQKTTADRLMEGSGLFRGQAIILLIVSEREGATHSEIAAKLRISPAAASKVIKRLEEKGLLQRSPDPSDERMSRVHLLESGRAAIQQILCSFNEIEGSMLKGLSREERATLGSLLHRVYANLQALQQE